MASQRRAVPVIFAIVLASCLALSGGAVQAADEPDPVLQERHKALFQELLRAPVDMDLLFEYAGVSVQLGNYETAISAYERMLLLNPELPRVKLELGALYYRLDSYEAAKRYLEDAQNDPDVPPVVQERIDEYLALIDDATTKSLWLGSLTVAGRYQTNANAGPENIIVRAAGQPAEIGDEFQPEDDFSFVVLGTARNLYRLNLGADGEGLPFDNELLWQTDIEAYYSAEVEYQNLNVGLIALETGPQFEVKQGDPDADPWFVRPYLLADFASLGQKPFYWTVGGGFSVTTTIDEWIGVQGWYEISYRDFNNTDDNPDLDELTGLGNAVGLDSNILVTDRLRGRLGAYVDFDSARVDFQSNTEFGIYGGIDYLYDAPLRLTEYPWEASFTATGVLTNYRSADPSVDPDVTRHDREYSLNFVNSVPIYDNMSLVGQVEWLDNNSNLPNFRFNNLSVLFGATLEF